MGCSSSREQPSAPARSPPWAAVWVSAPLCSPQAAGESPLWHLEHLFPSSCAHLGVHTIVSPVRVWWFCPLFTLLSPRCPHGGCGAQPCPAWDRSGWWNRLCPAQGSPGLSSPHRAALQPPPAPGLLHPIKIHIYTLNKLTETSVMTARVNSNQMILLFFLVFTLTFISILFSPQNLQIVHEKIRSSLGLLLGLLRNCAESRRLKARK